MTTTTTEATTITEGDRVLVTYSEPGSPAFEKWSGPGTVRAVRERSISVLTDKGDVGAFAPSCIEPLVPGGFKIGDEVIVLADNWPSTAQPGDYGRITGTDGVYVLVDVEKSGTTGFPFRPSEILLADVKLFEDGDEVESVGAPFFATGAYDRAHGRYYNDRVERGQRATVTFQYGAGPSGEYIVRFGDGMDDATTVSSKALQLVQPAKPEPAPESHGGLTVGDRVRFADQSYDFDGELFGREGEVVGFTSSGDFVTVLFDGDDEPTFGWYTHRYELVEPLAEWELELLAYAAEEEAKPSFTEGDIVLVPLGTTTTQGGAVYFDTEVEAVVDYQPRNRDEDICVRDKNGTLVQYVDPKQVYLVSRAGVPDTVEDAALLGATVEDEEALDALPEFTVIRGIRRSDIFRQKQGGSFRAFGREGTFDYSTTAMATNRGGAVVVHLGHFG